MHQKWPETVNVSIGQGVRLGVRIHLGFLLVIEWGDARTDRLNHGPYITTEAEALPKNE